MPRVVDLWAVPAGGPQFTESCLPIFGMEPMIYKSYALAPVILHTSRESREVGLKHYDLAFGTKYNIQVGKTQIDIVTPPQIYVHWACDILCSMPISVHQPEGWDEGRDWDFYVADFNQNRYNVRRMALHAYVDPGMFLNLVNRVEEVMIWRDPGIDDGYCCYRADKPISLKLVNFGEDGELDIDGKEEKKWTEEAKANAEEKIRNWQMDEVNDERGPRQERWIPSVITTKRMIVEDRTRGH